METHIKEELEGIEEHQQHHKNPRATKAKLTERQKATLALLKEGPCDIYKISEELSLSMPQAMTVVKMLLESKKIKKCGREGRRMNYGISGKSVSKANGFQTVWAGKPSTISLPVQVGEKLEVVSVLISNKGIQLNVVDVDSKSNMTLLVAS